MMRYFFVFLLLLNVLGLRAQDAYSISGVVKDNKGETLPGATVFLSGTKAITACNKDGAFSLSAVSPGSYLLIVKYLGFHPLNLPINVVNQPLSLKLTLLPNLNQLSQVVVTADPDWEAHYQIFKKRFFGTTPNAEKCRILNKEALHFHYNKKLQLLSATADEFLIIENDQLGYKISYSLDSFEFNEDSGILKYQGNPSFAELKPVSEKQLNLWQKNRSTAYNGSITHLMRSVYDGDPYRQGFLIYSLTNKPPIGTSYNNDNPVTLASTPVLMDSLLTVSDKNFKTLAYKNCLFVVYTKEYETFNFKNSGYRLTRPAGGQIPRGQYSMVNLIDADVTIDSHGNFSLPGGLLFEGYMGWEQIADLTPLEYPALVIKQ
jgi:hypothetical protein